MQSTSHFLNKQEKVAPGVSVVLPKLSKFAPETAGKQPNMLKTQVLAANPVTIAVLASKNQEDILMNLAENDTSAAVSASLAKPINLATPKEKERQLEVARMQTTVVNSVAMTVPTSKKPENVATNLAENKTGAVTSVRLPTPINLAIGIEGKPQPNVTKTQAIAVNPAAVAVSANQKQEDVVTSIAKNKISPAIKPDEKTSHENQTKLPIQGSFTTQQSLSVVHEQKNTALQLPELTSLYSEQAQDWQVSYFQEAVNAIAAADEEKLEFLLGPNLLSLNNLLDSAHLSKKFKENDILLVNLFYDRARDIVTGMQRVIALREKFKYYTEKVLRDQETAIKSMWAHKTKQQANAVLQLQEQQQAGLVVTISPQFSQSVGALNGLDQKLAETQALVASFDKLYEEFKQLSWWKFDHRKKYIFNFNDSPYAAIEQRLLQIYPKFEGLNSTEWTCLIVTPSYFRNALACQIEQLSHSLVQRLTPEITALEQHKKMSKLGITISYAQPIYQAYKAAIEKLLATFVEDIAFFRGGEKYASLAAVLAKIEVRREEASQKLLVQHSAFAKFESVSSESKTQEQIEYEYKQQATVWLRSQIRPVGVFNLAEIDKIIATQIGFASFCDIADQNGNTLVHHVMRQYCEATKAVPYSENRVKRLVSIFTKLLLRGGSVYTSNEAGQNAVQHAILSVPCKEFAQVNIERAFNAILDWSLLMKIINPIACYTPTTQKVKSILLEYSKTNERKLAQWSCIDSFLYSHVLISVHRVNEVAKIGQMLYATQSNLSDKILEDGVKALASRAPKERFWWLGYSDSLYENLLKVFTQKSIAYISLTEGEVERYRAIELCEQTKMRSVLEHQHQHQHQHTTGGHTAQELSVRLMAEHNKLFFQGKIGLAAPPGIFSAGLLPHQNRATFFYYDGTRLIARGIEPDTVVPASAATKHTISTTRG